MKRLNYWQVHKNKTPRKLRKRKTDIFAIQAIAITMASVAQTRIILSTPSYEFPTGASKAIEVVKQTMNHFEALHRLAARQRLERFKSTRRYVA